jgi:hypothetical protein
MVSTTKVLVIFNSLNFKTANWVEDVYKLIADHGTNLILNLTELYLAPLPEQSQSGVSYRSYLPLVLAASGRGGMQSRCLVPAFHGADLT